MNTAYMFHDVLQGSTKNFVSACPVGQVDHTFGCPVGRTTCPHFLFIFFIFNQSLFSVAKIKWGAGEYFMHFKHVKVAFPCNVFKAYIPSLPCHGNGLNFTTILLLILIINYFCNLLLKKL